jgi:hypothetical protein
MIDAARQAAHGVEHQNKQVRYEDPGCIEDASGHERRTAGRDLHGFPG